MIFKMKESLERKLTDLLVGFKVEQRIAEIAASDFINSNFITLNIQKAISGSECSNYSYLWDQEPSMPIDAGLNMPCGLYDRLTKEMQENVAGLIKPNAVTIAPNKQTGMITIRHGYLLPVENTQNVIPEIIKGKDVPSD